MTDQAITEPEAAPASPAGIRNAFGSVAGAFVASRVAIFALILLSRMDVIRGPLWWPGGLKEVLTVGEATVHLAPAQGAAWGQWAQQIPSLALSPLFALVVKATSVVVRDVALAGVLVANLSLLVAGLLLHRLIALEGGDARASRNAVMLMMFAPAAFFHSTATPDSMLLALAIGTVYAVRKGSWLLAATLAAAATAAGSYGTWLLVPLVVEFLQQRRARTVATPPMFLLSIPVSAALLLVALGSTWFSDSLAAFRSGARWERGFAALLQLSQAFASYRTFYEWMFWISIGAAVLITFAGWKPKTRPSYVALTAALVVACVWSHDLQAPRVLSSAFPLFIMMGTVSTRIRWSYDVFIASSMTLLALCTVAAANGFWIS